MDLLAMAPLRARDCQYIVWHTLGPQDPNGAPVDIDQDAGAINDYHRSKGWSGIGYHAVVRKDGAIEFGRPLTKQGAHVRGLNHCSLGIAFSGHGDLSPLTPSQWTAGLALTLRLVREYGIEPRNVIGHREAYRIPGVPDTGKSCPGVRVSMHKARKALVDLLHPLPPEIVIVP
jgi:hypothetical protein